MLAFSPEIYLSEPFDVLHCPGVLRSCTKKNISQIAYWKTG